MDGMLIKKVAIPRQLQQDF